MQLGIRAHDLGPDNAHELARKAAERGLQVVQLAPTKALVPPLASGSFEPMAIREIARTFSRFGVSIAVLGCYINPIHPDAGVRQQEILRFRESLRHAAEFGCSVVATETGSRNPDCSLHPDNHSESTFAECIDILGMLAEEARAAGVTLAIEAATEHVIHDLLSLERALALLGSNGVGVIFDPVNIMLPADLSVQAAFLERAFARLGPSISALHVKDVVLDHGRLRRVPPGKGQLDYASLLAHTHVTKADMPVIMEETDQPADRDAALRFLQERISIEETPLSIRH